MLGDVEGVDSHFVSEDGLFHGVADRDIATFDLGILVQTGYHEGVQAELNVFDVHVPYLLSHDVHARRGFALCEAQRLEITRT